jgi:hypothetical protein
MLVTLNPKHEHPPGVGKGGGGELAPIVFQRFPKIDIFITEAVASSVINF